MAARTLIRSRGGKHSRQEVVYRHLAVGLGVHLQRRLGQAFGDGRGEGMAGAGLCLFAKAEGFDLVMVNGREAYAEGSKVGREGTFLRAR